MSAFQNSTLQQCANDLIGFGGRTIRRSDRLADDVRSQVWVTRIATLCGFAGAVLIQAAVFSLIAQLVLGLDSALLPSLSISIVALALGALAVTGSKLLAGLEALAA
jgi:hypothetical protein